MSDVVVVVIAAALTAVLRIAPVILTRRSVVLTDDGAHTVHGQGVGELGEHVSLLPLAVLTALVVPGAALVDVANPWVGLAAAATSILVVIVVRRPPAYLVVVCAVGAAVVAHGLTR